MKFIFKGYNSNLKKGEILFNFQIKGDQNINFTEKISFPPVTWQIPENLQSLILDNLMIILGISYWKAYCPKEIIIESNFLNYKQAEFWNIVWTKGLGEFFYKNKIDFRGLVQFPFIENAQIPVSFPRKKRALLGLGGGKDSIVTAELLKAQNKNFDLFTVGTSKIQEEVANGIGKKPIVINRQLDPKLFDLNKEEGTFNGHIPISVVYAFLGLMASIFYDYDSVVVGNEKSANYGNVEYLGGVINHQWSKSEEFEELFRGYVKKFITLDVSYFSLLRNMNELEVTKEFVKYPKYFEVFSSCNRNFKISAPLRSDELRRGKWCGKCAKCLFVFTLLGAFISQEKLIKIFGKNLFEDQSLLPLFEELSGKRNFKPFECVGTPEEVRLALEKILEKREFNEDFLMVHFQEMGNRTILA